jgi:hypothetical protein
VAVAATAPAFASSTGYISGAQQVTRTPGGIVSTGSVTNGTSADQTVTLTWDWLCDSTGPGAGIFTGGNNTAAATGWTPINFTYVFANGNSQRGVRLTVRRVISAGQTVSMPTVTLTTSAQTVTGGVTAVLSAPAPATVVQPASVTFPRYTAPAAAPQARRVPALPPAEDMLAR